MWVFTILLVKIIEIKIKNTLSINLKSASFSAKFQAKMQRVLTILRAKNINIK
jgi:hypothetical protein